MDTNINENERTEIKQHIKKLRDRAEPIGPLHAMWDLIFDLEAILENRETFLGWNPQKYIEYARKCNHEK